MAEKSTYIKLDRNILEWRWFGDHKLFTVFIWLIIKANIKPANFQKDRIERGSVVTSNSHIAEGCRMTVDNVRTALANLESTGEITRIQRNHYQIITIVNYEYYQTGVAKQLGQIPSNPDSKSQPTAIADPNNIRIKEYNNGKNGKNNTAPLLQPYPCGAIRKPEWMDSDVWKYAKFRTVEDIPGLLQGEYETYIEYAEDLHKQGKDVR